MLERSLCPLLLLVVWGCSPSDSDSLRHRNAPAEVPAAGKGGAGTHNDKAEQPAAASVRRLERDGVSAVVASWEETQQFVARQTGKVVVLDVWSTWCPPCVREFPQLVALQRKYPGHVVCVSFNLNFTGGAGATPEAEADTVLSFLAERQAKLHNVISSTPDETFYDTVDLAGPPAVFVYAADGKLQRRFDNDNMEYGEAGFTYEEHVVPLVEMLLPAQRGDGGR